MSGTGSAGMETCFVNLVEPGDTVIIGVNGVFGERMCEVARRCGAEVVRVEAPSGRAIDPQRMLDRAPRTSGARVRDRSRRDFHRGPERRCAARRDAGDQHRTACHGRRRAEAPHEPRIRNAKARESPSFHSCSAASRRRRPLLLTPNIGASDATSANRAARDHSARRSSLQAVAEGSDALGRVAHDPGQPASAAEHQQQPPGPG